MALQFKKASKQQAKLRMAIVGPAGAGKTFSSLSLATGLGSKIAVIDTERGSAAKYADEFSFDTLELESYEPETYVAAIKAAEEAGYDVLVIDSLSHAWVGKGGALEQANNETLKQRTPNSYTAWRNVTPRHNAMIDAIVGCKCHVIATMRSKTEYVQEKDDRGKTTIRKVGLAPIQREGAEYEFDVVGDIDQDNNFVITKTRCSKLSGKVYNKPGQELSETLKAWLTDGEPMQEKASVQSNGSGSDWPALISALEKSIDDATNLDSVNEIALQASVAFKSADKETREKARALIAASRKRHESAGASVQ